MSTISIEQLVAAVEAAGQRLASGEAKARQAKALLLQAEKVRDEAAARQAEAEQQLAAIEAALSKARALRALVGDGGSARAKRSCKRRGPQPRPRWPACGAWPRRHGPRSSG